MCTVAISVSDEGRGLSAERLPHLFRKYSRINSEDLGRHPAGEGLGLAILQGNSGGARGPDTGRERGTGTRNAVHLHGSGGRRAVQRLGNRPRPRSPPTQDGRREAGRAFSQSTTSRQILRLVRNTLSDAGYTPIVTGDPDEVLHLIEQEKPHLVLLDMMLPGTDGIELMTAHLGDDRRAGHLPGRPRRRSDCRTGL